MIYTVNTTCACMVDVSVRRGKERFDTTYSVFAADNPDDHEMVPVGDFQILFDNETNEGEQVFVRWPNVTIHWPGGRTGPPRDSPECGFHGELCIEPKGEGENFLFSFLSL